MGVFVFILTFLTYLVLSWSGTALPAYEYIVAFVLAAGLTVALHFGGQLRRYGLEGINLRRWGLFFYYVFGPFALALVKANIDVALRIITGRVKPGVVCIHSGLKDSLAQTLLADSITLTPGTMTVEINEENGDLYIHWIYVSDINPSQEDIYGDFGKWARRLTQ